MKEYGVKKQKAYFKPLQIEKLLSTFNILQ